MTNLSPAAQAVLRAAIDAHDEWDINDSIAAALRAAANEVVPVPIEALTSEEHWALLGARNRLLAIADELQA